MWVTGQPGTLVEIQPSTGTVLNSFSIGGNNEGIAFDGGNMWVAVNNLNEILKVKVATGTVVGTVGVPTPSAVVFDGTNIWVTQAQPPTA